MIAITQLAAEKNLPKEVVLRTVESALLSAFKRENFAAGQNLAVRISPQSGEAKVYIQRNVVETVADPRREISVAEAQKVKKDARPGDIVQIESTSQNIGRIVAQIARQVISQRLREAEQDAIFAEYAEKEGEIVSGIIQRIEPKQIIIDLDRVQAVLPLAEQMPTEHYRVGQRIKLCLLEVSRSNKGSLIVSRAHRNLLRRLFELEIAEIRNGSVELKAIAREPGSRSKVAVASRQENIDPVACCVGKRGIRIQNITRELNGEKVDVVQWNPNPGNFIARSLSPAQVSSVEVNEKDKIATVVVPDRHLSLAIGKEGQNARLAAKLTGWRIDIKSVSIAEAERLAKEETLAAAFATKEEIPAITEPKAEKEVIAKAALFEEKKEESLPSLITAKAEKEPAAEEAEPVAVSGSPLSLETFLIETEATREEQQIRFAEDLVPAGSGQPTKAKKDKKKGSLKEEGAGIEGGIKLKKRRRQHLDLLAEDEDYETPADTD